MAPTTGFLLQVEKGERVSRWRGQRPRARRNALDAETDRNAAEREEVDEVDGLWKNAS